MRHKQPLAALALVACCVTIVALCLAVVAPLLHGAAGRAAVQRDASQEDVVVVSDTSAADDGKGSGEASPSDAAQAADGAGVSSPRQTGMPSDEGNAEADTAFVMPEGAEYVPDVALLRVDPDTDPDTVRAVLAQAEGAVEREVSPEEIANGLIEVEVEEGVSVEAAVNDLLEAGAAVGADAQPNYLYYTVSTHAPRDLVNLLKVSLTDEPLLEEAAELLSADDEVAAETEADEADVASEATSEAAVSEASPEEDASGAEDEAASVSDEAGAASEEAPESEAGDEPAAEADADGANPADDASAETADEQDDDDALDASDLLETLEDAVTVNDPDQASQWALADIKAYQAWSIARCENDVTVALLDSGFQTDHTDLAANMLTSAGRGATSKDGAFGTDVTPLLSSGKDFKHGTHVSGIVSGLANNGVGIAGVSYNANILPVRVFYKSGASVYSNTYVLCAAFDYVIENASTYNVRVINLSVGSTLNYYSEGYSGSRTTPDSALYERIDEALAQGIVTVTSAGNGASSGAYEEFPADYENAVGVINITSSHVRSSTSNYNVSGQKTKNISAPGTSIYSTIPSNSYDSMSGTSMAAPCVAGVLALEFAANPSLSATEAIDILYETATDIGSEGWDLETGYGEVNAYEAVKAARDAPITCKDISAATLTLSPTSYIYDGTAKCPDVTVTYDGATLRPSYDYQVSYANNINLGLGTVTVQGVGGYTGTLSARFRIGFTDVPSTSWAYGVVNRAFDLGLISGYASAAKVGMFGPDDHITRADLVTILWRMADRPAAASSATTFSDVARDAYYYAAVLWARDAGVVSGYSGERAGQFGPTDEVTREQLAVMLANYARSVAGKSVTGSAADYAAMSDASEVSPWAERAVGWCFKNAILSGSEGKILPKDHATRAHAAKMVVFLYDLLNA